MAQPTEQCVHTVRFTSILPPRRLACGLCLADHVERQLAGRGDNAAPAPTVTPERLRKVAAVHGLGQHAGQARASGARETGALLDFRVSNMAPPQTLAVR